MKNEVETKIHCQWPHYGTVKYEGDGIIINISVSAGPLFADKFNKGKEFCESVKMMEGQNNDNRA